MALLEEFRQKITHERIASYVREVKQEELIALIKLEAEVKARYLVAVLEIIDPKLSDLPGRVAEAKRYREMAEEIGRAVKAVVDGILEKEIAMPGLEHAPEFPPDIERAIEEFIASNQEARDLFK